MATDRLRRKLRDVDPDELSTLTESFCTIGTPLPSLTSHKKDQNELKPIWQQEARDAQGRRRFHGAFTGGWSAGYFNTVGSKEGWTPGSFRSSRKDRQDGGGGRDGETGRVGSRPEDFMDEEDLQDWKAAQHVSSSSSFGATNQVAGLRGTNDPLTGALLGSIDVGASTDDDIGYRLLRRMGWKPGQGLGPKVNASKRARLLSLISTSDQPETMISSSSVKMEDTMLYYPPPTPLLTSAIGQQGRSSRKGLGAQDTPTLAQTLAKKHLNSATDAASVARAYREDAEVWPDGRPLLSGFRLARQPLPAEHVFEGEAVPEGWQPDPTRVWARYAAPSDEKVQHLTPATRGQLLGEAKLPGPPPNIAAFLSAKARERLASDSNLALPSSLSTQRPPRTEYVDAPRLEVATAKQALQGFAPFGADAAKQERYLSYLRGQADPGSEQATRLPVPLGLSTEQYSNELREFAKSASMFRPMSSAIASRFAPASAAVMEHETRATTATPGLRHPAPASASKDRDVCESTVAEPERELSIAQSAAQMGNFGHLTRQIDTWAPERLLCKRFGVPEPPVSRKGRGEDQPESSNARPYTDDDPDPFYGSSSRSKSSAVSAVRVDQHWERNKEQLKALAASGQTPLSLDAQLSTRRDTPHTPDATQDSHEQDTVGMAGDERQGRDTLSYVKPSMDVYKAIFASDEEASDAEQERDTTTKPKMQDPTSGVGVVFRAKRKDGAEDAVAPVPKGQGDKKRKKGKAAKKSLLTFDLDDEGEAAQAEERAANGVVARSKTKPRMRASDLF
ncbi:hypothetical protein EX895_006097 [Sporisorium graminicola]|uniref:G-patch domain-containing protein n=1 Tax=Sporisorium graminicola TaxID=280036 RepID=A0A4U7KMH9_9BASI|nr:hypothetical protein EX895_006097 [Sporisorium graminicola]TKY85017.1 hypothetical protein EX895_006097 [Sporisorium graminicola]